MRRLLTLSLVCTFFLVVPGTLVGKAHVPLSIGKAHVPLGMVQVCRKNDKVKNVSESSLARFMDRGACRLTACASNEVDGDDVITQYVFLPGGSCDATDANDDGWCDATGAPSEVPAALSAVGITPACTPSH